MQYIFSYEPESSFPYLQYKENNKPFCSQLIQNLYNYE